MSPRPSPRLPLLAPRAPQLLRRPSEGRASEAAAQPAATPGTRTRASNGELEDDDGSSSERERIRLRECVDKHQERDIVRDLWVCAMAPASADRYRIVTVDICRCVGRNNAKRQSTVELLRKPVALDTPLPMAVGRCRMRKGLLRLARLAGGAHLCQVQTRVVPSTCGHGSEGIWYVGLKTKQRMCDNESVDGRREGGRDGRADGWMDANHVDHDDSSQLHTCTNTRTILRNTGEVLCNNRAGPYETDMGQGGLGSGRQTGRRGRSRTPHRLPSRAGKDPIGLPKPPQPGGLPRTNPRRGASSAGGAVGVGSSWGSGTE